MLPQMPAAAPEIVALGSALSDVISSVKAKASVLQDAEAAIPSLLAAMKNIADFGVDIKKPENQAYLIWAIAQSLEPVVA